MAATTSSRGALAATALSPLLPQLIGSVFNIWYNHAVVEPLLAPAGLLPRFLHTVAIYNGLVYPLAVALWLRLVFSLRPTLRRLVRGQPCRAGAIAAARHRLILLPWLGAALAGVAWFLCIPVFVLSLGLAGRPLDPQLWWHLPTSFLVSGTIAVTHSFFLIEIISQQKLFPWFFEQERPDRTPGVRVLSLRCRGVLWAISSSVCPLLSLLLLSFAPTSEGSEWFVLFVAAVGIAFSLTTALMLNRLVASPLDDLRRAVVQVAQGDLDASVPVQRADELGILAAEVNRMIAELRAGQQVRRTFGLHVGRKVAERLLARHPGSGAEETITVMFVDIRNFTRRSLGRSPHEVVSELNEFLTAMVTIVEKSRHGMINKFVGDGFMAIFGVDAHHPCADEAIAVGRALLRGLEALNARITARGQPPLAIGIGLHTGPAVVGSIGSTDRMEFTAIGSSVNLASRIEGLTKELGVPLLFTDATRAAFGGAARDLGAHAVRGMAEPVRLYTV